MMTSQRSEGSVAVLRGALSTGGQLPNFLGVLAGSPADVARLRTVSVGAAPRQADGSPTLERIALAVAEYYHSEPGIAMHSRAALGVGLAFPWTRLLWRAGFDSRAIEREAALLTVPARPLLTDGPARDVPARRGPRGRMGRRADPRGDRGASTLEAFTAMVNVAGEVPVDGSTEASRGAARLRDSDARHSPVV